jgi:hypothetical protein
MRCRNAREQPYDATIMKLRAMSVVLAAGVASAILAAPAQADTSGTVDDFLSTLDRLDITGIDPAKAVAVGESLCPMLAERGQNTADIAAKVSDAIGRPLGASTMFTGAAISFLCPRAIENVTDNLSGSKPLLPLFGD